ERARSAPSSAHTRTGIATKSATRENTGGADNAASAPATISNRARRHPWLSIANSACAVMAAPRTAKQLRTEGGRVQRRRQSEGRLPPSWVTRMPIRKCPGRLANARGNEAENRCRDAAEPPRQEKDG